MVLIFCAAAMGQTSKQKADIEVQILGVIAAQAEAWNRGSVEDFMKGYWNSDQLVFVSGASVTLGYHPMLERYKKNYSTKEKMGMLTFEDIRVNVISKDAAVVYGSWAVKNNDGDPKGKFTLIFQRFREGWRVIHDHTS